MSFSTEPTNAFTGLVSDGIGVRTTGEGNGQPCGRIDGSQKLIMDLGPALDGTLIDFAEIDVELKFAATLSIQGYFVDEEGVASPVGPASTYDSTGSDSGPDSGDNDNYRVRFPEDGSFTAVNRLVFSIATTGGASLEGGADGTQACDTADSAACDPGLGQTIDDPDGVAPFDNPTTDSLFHLIEGDGVLDCGDVFEETNNGITTTVARLDNADGGLCTAIPYSQDANQNTGDCDPDAEGFLQCIFFKKDVDTQQAQFFWKVVWAPEEGSYMEAPTEFDFGDGNGFVPLQLCGPSTGAVDPPFAEELGFPDFYPTPSTDPWCVVDTQTELQADGQVVVTEVFFGQFDPTGRR